MMRVPRLNCLNSPHTVRQHLHMLNILNSPHTMRQHLHMLNIGTKNYDSYRHASNPTTTQMVQTIPSPVCVTI